MLARLLRLVPPAATAAFVLHGTFATAQASGEREILRLDIRAGATVREASCGTWSFTFGDASAPIRVESPSTSPASILERVEDVFGTGPAAATGTNCDVRGRRVAAVSWTAADTGTCPTLDLTFPGLVRAARHPLSSTGLVRRDTFTWSVTPLVKVLDVHTHGERVKSDGGEYVVWHGDPSAQLRAAAPDTFVQQLAAFETLPPAQLPEPLRAVYALHAPIRVIGDFEATVKFTSTHGSTAQTTAHVLGGIVAADGSYSIQHMREVPGEGERAVTLIEHVAFDGATLFHGSESALYFHAYSASAAVTRPLVAAHGLLTRPLVEWARSPFGIPLVPGARHAIETRGARTTVRETYPFLGAGSGWTTVYVIDTDSAPHVTSIEVLAPESAPTGKPVRRVEFGDYRELAPGIWRPFHMIERDYSQEGSVTTITTTDITRAHLSESAVPSQVKAHARWFVHL